MRVIPHNALLLTRLHPVSSSFTPSSRFIYSTSRPTSALNVALLARTTTSPKSKLTGLLKISQLHYKKATDTQPRKTTDAAHLSEGLSQRQGHKSQDTAIASSAYPNHDTATSPPTEGLDPITSKTASDTCADTPRPTSANTKTNTAAATPPTNTMSADDDYAAFLDKANQDVSGAGTQGSNSETREHKKKAFAEKSVDTEEREVPAVLKKVDEVYVSETDEKWEVVWLKCPDNHGLDEHTISHLTSIPFSSIDTLNPTTFDPRNEYKAVIDAAATAAGVSKKDIKVFRVEMGRSRCEYWVVGLKEGKRLVGFRAKAVET